MSPTKDTSNIYQLTGLDERERGFNRQVTVSCQEGGYQGAFSYERVRIETPRCDSEAATLENLVEQLHNSGFTCLRTQLIFRKEQYLGSQELWVDYPDPQPRVEESTGWVNRIRRMFAQGND